VKLPTILLQRYAHTSLVAKLPVQQISDAHLAECLKHALRDSLGLVRPQVPGVGAS